MDFKNIISTATQATKKGAGTVADVTSAIAKSPEVKEAAQVLGKASVDAAKFTGTATVFVATKAGNLMAAVYRAGKNALNKDNGDSNNKPNFLK